MVVTNSGSAVEFEGVSRVGSGAVGAQHESRNTDPPNGMLSLNGALEENIIR